MGIARIGERYAGARDALDWPRALSHFGTKRGMVVWEVYLLGTI